MAEDATMGGTTGPTGGRAFVLGGGGVLGGAEVGMVRALFESGTRPDLMVGTSVGAINGALVAADPTPSAVARLRRVWRTWRLSGSSPVPCSPGWEPSCARGHTCTRASRFATCSPPI